MAFPTGTPSYQGFTPGDTLKTDNHAAQHNQEQADIIALANKVGTGSSTPTSGKFLKGNGSGASAWTALTSADVSDLLSTVIQAVYPVGSLYCNAADSTNPATLLGFGTWVAFGAGRVPVGKAAAGTFSTIGATGGEETHTLVTSEMPSHNHGAASLIGQFIMHNQSVATNIAGMSGIVSPTGSNPNYAAPTTTGAATSYGVINIDASHTHTTNGSDAAHNNLQPYIVVYMWQRTA